MFKLLTAANIVSQQVEDTYLQHIAEYGKSYGTEEEYQHRLKIFNLNVIMINEHNQNVTGDDARMGINHMADWTDGEYKRLLGFRSNPSAKKTELFTGEGVEVPDSVDWTKKGAVTPVKNQGSCGSCWAFSTTGGMEGRYQIAGNPLTSFSEQQFVDCSKSGNEGCNGGLMDTAFKFAEGQKIETEAQYPYTGRDGTCAEQGGVTEVKSYQDVEQSAEALMAAVSQGPVSIALDASGIGFQLYFGGIMHYMCGTELDHGVLLVGYGTQKGLLWGTTDYWLVKNSWGSWWGESGYFKVFRDKTSTDKGICGIQSSASFPTF